MNNLTLTETATAVTQTSTQKEFHTGTGKTSFRHQGRKWHFTTRRTNDETYTAIIQLRGGLKVASRVATLVEKDVMKTGKLGGQRANIQRLIESANN